MLMVADKDISIHSIHFGCCVFCFGKVIRRHPPDCKLLLILKIRSALEQVSATQIHEKHKTKHFHLVFSFQEKKSLGQKLLTIT